MLRQDSIMRFYKARLQRNVIFLTFVIDQWLNVTIINGSLCGYLIFSISSHVYLVKPGKPYRRGRLIDLLDLTSLGKLIFILIITFTLVTKHVTLIRKSIVLSLPIQCSFIKRSYYECKGKLVTIVRIIAKMCLSFGLNGYRNKVSTQHSYYFHNFLRSILKI